MGEHLYPHEGKDGYEYGGRGDGDGKPARGRPDGKPDGTREVRVPGHGGDGHTPDGGKLSAADRKRIPKSEFAVPSKAPGSGSYPIENKSHAREALARASGKPVEDEVDAAVHRRYPGMGKK